MKNIVKKTYNELKSKRPTINELQRSQKHPICVIVENIRSLYNVGSIFRTSDGAGIEKLYLTGFTGYPPRKEIDKTALGSVATVPWEYNPKTIEVIKKLKEEMYSVVALEHTHSSTEYYNHNTTFPLALIIGNEVDGIDQATLKHCDHSIEIPMYGIKQSLNVSVAYGIIMYHFIHQYTNNDEIK